jgi:hypothetical protein
MPLLPFSPEEVARVGRKLYDRHRTDLESQWPGQFALVDVRTEKIFIADTVKTAYEKARSEGPGPFHLVKIGSRATFRSRRPA